MQEGRRLFKVRNNESLDSLCHDYKGKGDTSSKYVDPCRLDPVSILGDPTPELRGPNVPGNLGERISG